LTDCLIGELALLRRTGSVDEYYNRVMALSCHSHSITEAQQIQLFVTGLGQPQRMDIALKQPASLDEAVVLARAYEQHDAPRVASPTPTRSQTRFSTKPPVSSATSAAVASAAASPSVTGGKSPTTLLLMPGEIADS
jgi:hypothetical protein